MPSSAQSGHYLKLVYGDMHLNCLLSSVDDGGQKEGGKEGANAINTKAKDSDCLHS